MLRLARNRAPWLAALLGLVGVLWMGVAALRARSAAPAEAPEAALRPEREAVFQATHELPEPPTPSSPALPYERIAQVMAMRPAGEDLATLVEIARNDPDPALREAAVVALANAEDGRAIDALIAASRDPERRVALAAIELLSWTEDRSARAAIEAAARSDDPEVAGAAARIVAR